VDTVVAGVCVLLALLALVVPANVQQPVAAAMRQTAGVPLVRLQERAVRSRNAFLSHDSVTRVLDSLALRSMNVQPLETENARLRALLGLARRLEWGFIPAEALTDRGPGDEFKLSVGSNAGVQPFTPVVAPEGLVGMVRTVDPTMSLAVLWTHPDFRASAMSQDASTVGIVQAHLSAGPDRYLLEMRGVPFRSTLKPGTLIVTSGLGGTYPRGLAIGEVVGELKTAEGWARTYLLRPAVRPTDVRSVMVLLPPRAAAGIETVWASARGADSAARAVYAWGDSIYRDSVAADSARRAVIADSVRADSLRRFPPAAPAAAPPAAPSSRQAPSTPARPPAVPPPTP
jgi:rod shape-determining protein MreC